MIPPVTARTADGRVVQAWDWKQKRSLLIAFLHADCAECEAFLARVKAEAPRLAELEATALIVLPEPPPARLADAMPPHVVLAADISGRSQRAFLGKDALDTSRQARASSVGVFVTDRFGELHAQWCGGHESLPGVPDAFSWLHQVQIACEECGAPHWAVE
jgi:peroxiredoxin